MRLLITTQTVDRTDPTLGFFHAWLCAFAKEFERVEVICLQEGEHALPENVRVHSLGKGQGAGKLQYLWRFYRLLFSLRTQYDAVFVHMNPEYVVLGGLFWRVMGKKVSLWYTHKMVDTKLRLATLFAHRIFTASTESFRLQSKKMRVVGHGIDTSLFVPTEHEHPHPFTLASVGRMTKRKRLTLLLDVLAKCDNTWQLVLVGVPATIEDEAYVESLNAQAKMLSIAERVHMLGGLPHEKVVSVLHDADVFVNVSETDSLDKAVLEALLCGVPAVTTNRAFKEIAAHIDERLFLSEATAAALCERLKVVANLSPEEKKKVLIKAREYIQKEHALSSLPRKIHNELL